MDMHITFYYVVYHVAFFAFILFSSSLLQAKAEEELQETQGHIDSLLNELSSLNQPGGRGVGSGVAKVVTDAPFSQPEGAVMSHTETLQVRVSHLCVARFDLNILQHNQVMIYNV